MGCLQRVLLPYWTKTVSVGMKDCDTISGQLARVPSARSSKAKYGGRGGGPEPRLDLGWQTSTYQWQYVRTLSARMLESSQNNVGHKS